MENKKQESSCIFGSPDFTSGGLGLVASSKPEMNTYIKSTMHTSQMVNQFNMFWNDTSRVKDVKESLLQTLEGVYKENTSEFIYFVTLYNIFKDYLDNLSEEDIVKSKTGFKESVVWNKLYNFQKDGVLGTIDKLEKYNGCILADSVGLGKTFEAFAVIKYYESRNNRVLVLCPKKLRENWLTYKGNRKDNLLEKDRLINFIQSKKILDLYKKVCSGENRVYSELIAQFNTETNEAKDMRKFTNFLEKTVENIVGKEEEKGLESLFSFGETSLNNSIQNMDDFELISFLVIK